MKTLLTILLVVLSFNLYAQNTDTSHKDGYKSQIVLSCNCQRSYNDDDSNNYYN